MTSARNPVPDDTVGGTSVDDQPVADLSHAPLPTRSTLRRRQNLFFQAGRFLTFNAKILRMVVRGHSNGK